LYRPGMALDHIAPELPSILLMNCESPHPVGVSKVAPGLFSSSSLGRTSQHL
jgi:hypothetical protein